MTASDYEREMNAAPERRKPAEKLRPRALAERIADHLIRTYPEAHQLELIQETLERRMREQGKLRILRS